MMSDDQKKPKKTKKGKGKKKEDDEVIQRSMSHDMEIQPFTSNVDLNQ